MKKKICAAVMLLALLAGLLAVSVWVNKQEEEPIDNAGQAVHGVREQVSLTYQGGEYPLKEQLNTVLLIGTDGTESYEEKDELLQDYYNYSQADFLLLLVQDKKENTTQVIQINRDTMTDVPWLDVIGNYGGTEFGQICLAFNSGDGGRDSCLNTVDAVSSLLFDAPIRHYIQMPMTAVSALNDLVGGVVVEIPEDMTNVDPMFVKDATVRLSGDQAEKFVRARREMDNDTNVSRMSRQRIYMESFRKQAQAELDSDSEFVLRMVEKVSEHIQTDLTAQQLSDFVQSLDQSQVSSISAADGNLVAGETYYEFYVDETSLWKIVKEAYCQ